GWEQEDDITLVTLRRSAQAEAPVLTASSIAERELDAFTVEGADGHERAAMRRVAEAVAGLGLTPEGVERLKTAVAETVMNAIEYGSHNHPTTPADAPGATDHT